MNLKWLPVSLVMICVTVCEAIGYTFNDCCVAEQDSESTAQSCSLMNFSIVYELIINICMVFLSAFSSMVKKLGSIYNYFE